MDWKLTFSVDYSLQINYLWEIRTPEKRIECTKFMKFLFHSFPITNLHMHISWYDTCMLKAIKYNYNLKLEVIGLMMKGSKSYYQIPFGQRIGASLINRPFVTVQFQLTQQLCKEPYYWFIGRCFLKVQFQTYYKNVQYLKIHKYMEYFPSDVIQKQLGGNHLM